MTDVNEIYPSTYMKADDLADDPQGQWVEIGIVKPQLVGQGDTGETKLVAEVIGANKSLVLNKTNAMKLAELLGRDYATWPGCQMCLVKLPVDFKGKVTKAIRVLDAKRLDTSPASCSQEVSHG